jgi:penicillin-binding protein 1C
LNLYLTLAPCGGNIEGVRAASLAYFGKEPKTLTLAESALLVALPQSPERARPDRNPETAEAARDKVLTRLEAQGMLAADEAAEARVSAIPTARLPMPLDAPQLADRMKAGHSGEPVITTTLDKGLQTALAGLAVQETLFLDDGADIAIVVVKTDTREVLGEIGGANYWGPAGHVDLASAMRSPGSALKPFIYGFAFDDLALHPATLMQDEAAMFGDYAPKNFDGDFHGTVTATDALRMSLNVPAVAVLERVGPLRFTLALQHAGAHLGLPGEAGRPSLPIALGGIGISLRDMTMLYVGIADGGQIKPLRETKDPTPPPFRLFGPVAAYYLRGILSGAALPNGWAMGQGLRRTRSIAFKTGTSYGYRDAWSVGFSNDYTVGVWVGRADGAPRADRLGREDAAPVLLKVFDLLPADRHLAPAPPADAILISRSEQLPPTLRTFRREANVAAMPKARINPPTIAFPPDGAVVGLPAKADPDQTIALKANGGRAPLTWLVNGAVVGSFGRYEASAFAPDGEGFARITVIDADGRSATARVRLTQPRQ